MYVSWEERSVLSSGCCYSLAPALDGGAGRRGAGFRDQKLPNSGLSYGGWLTRRASSGFLEKGRLIRERDLVADIVHRSELWIEEGDVVQEVGVERP